MVPVPIGSWDGIELGASPHRVTHLELWRRGLKGNDLLGDIPPELGKLSKLEFLHLHQNHLTGPIPGELGQLYNLRVMDLQGNDLTGSIPPELGQLGSLEFLNLSSNELSGEIPAELTDLSFRVQMVLNNNRFTGCVPLRLIANLRPKPSGIGLPFCFAVDDDPMTVSSAALLTVPEGDTLAIEASDLLYNDSDKSGPLTIIGVRDAVNGKASVDGARIFYTHDGSETTTGLVQYIASNGQHTDSATVRVAVTSVNDPPLWTGDLFAVDEGQEVSMEVAALLANDTDPEEDPLSITAVGDAVNERVAWTGTTISYRHDGSETATGGFSYTVSDGAPSPPGSTLRCSR